jgi:hypothetical protein
MLEFIMVGIITGAAFFYGYLYGRVAGYKAFEEIGKEEW